MKNSFQLLVINYQLSVPISRKLWTENWTLEIKQLKTVFFIVLFLSVAIFPLKSSSQTTNIDSLENLFNQYEEQNIKGYKNLELIIEIYNYYKISSPPKAIEFATVGLQISEEIKDSLKIASFYQKIGDVYYSQKIYYQAMESYFKALTIYENKGLKSEYAYELINIANTYLAEGINNNFALNYYQEAALIFDKIDDDFGLSECYDKIAIIHSENKNYEEAIKYAIKSLSLRQLLRNDELISHTYFDIAKIYKKQKKYDDAINYLENSLVQLGTNTNNKAQIYFELADNYLLKKEYEKAIDFLNLANKVYEKLEDKINIAETNNLYAKIYFAQKKYIKAINYAQEALIISDKNNFLEPKEEAYITLSNIYAEIDEIDLALRSYHKYSQIKDSIFKEKTQDKYTELQVGIKTMFQEKENQLLRRETAINETKNKQQQIVIYLFILLAVSLFLTIIVLTRSFLLKKISERRLLESEKRFKQFAEATQEGIAIHDEKVILEVNDKFCKLTDYKRDDLIGKSYLKLIAKENIELVSKKNNLEAEYIYEAVHLKKDGTKFYAEILSKPFIFRNKKAKVVSLRDLTEIKKARKKLKETEIRYKTLIDTSPDAIIIQNDEDKIIDANPYSSDVFGYTFDEFTKKSFFELIPKKERNKLNLTKYAKSHEILELPAIRKNGEKIIIQVAVSMVYFSDKDFYMFIIRDITKQKENENNLKRSSSNLKISNATKDKMFSIIAHDLRGPIGNLKAMMELIIESPEEFETDELKDIMVSLKESSVSTYELLENLLNWAKSQQNLIEYNPKVYDINKIISNTIKIFNNSAQRKNIEIKTELSENIQVILDINMIRTVLRNLLHNAIKFTQENGEITIKHRLGNDYVIISVSDNGVGIPEENIHKLFDNNQFFTTYGTNQEKGTGIGLPLCKEFIEKNNGEIWVDSSKNGSTFNFSLRRD